MSNIYYKRIVINSSQRLTAQQNSTNNFEVDIKDSFQLQNISHIAVESVSLSNVEYNITSLNNTIRVDNGGLPTTLTIPVGQYDITSLLTALNTSFNAFAPTFTITQDAITRKIKIESTGLAFTIHSILTTIHTVIGIDFGSFIGITSHLVGLIQTLDATNVPNLGGVDCAFIHSRALAGNSASNASAGSISLLTYLSFADVPFGGSGVRYINDAELSKIRYSQPTNLSTIDIKVRKADGSLLDLQNSPVQVIVRCYYSFD